MLLTAFLGYLEYNPKTTDIKFPIPRKFEVKILSRKSEETGRSEKIIYRNDPWGAPDTLTARCEIRCTRKKAWITPSCAITRPANNLQSSSVHFRCPLMSIIYPPSYREKRSNRRPNETSFITALEISSNRTTPSISIPFQVALKKLREKPACCGKHNFFKLWILCHRSSPKLRRINDLSFIACLAALPVLQRMQLALRQRFPAYLPYSRK